MKFKEPKNSSGYYWTDHVKFKMRYYALSPQRVLGIINKPQRKEEGIVKNTIAVMQPVNPKIINNKAIWKQEVWVMYQNHAVSNIKHGTKNKINTRYKIISAWRYPGVSPKKNPVPRDILRELKDEI